ncbi:MAG: acetylglutamate kinase, partial [Ilumatobacteraceae bacterium]
MKIAASTRAAVLSEALPHLQRFAGHVVVVKYGGNALAGSGDDAMEVFARDIALLHAVGIKPVVVHGGGPQISALMDRLGKQATFHNGLRVTDAETMEIVSMVLLGTVN